MKLNLKKVLVAAALFCGASLAVGSVNSTFAMDSTSAEASAQESCEKVCLKSPQEYYEKVCLKTPDGKTVGDWMEHSSRMDDRGFYTKLFFTVSVATSKDDPSWGDKIVQHHESALDSKQTIDIEVKNKDGKTLAEKKGVNSTTGSLKDFKKGENFEYKSFNFTVEGLDDNEYDKNVDVIIKDPETNKVLATNEQRLQPIDTNCPKFVGTDGKVYACDRLVINYDGEEGKKNWLLGVPVRDLDNSLLRNYKKNLTAKLKNRDTNEEIEIKNDESSNSYGLKDMFCLNYTIEGNKLPDGIYDIDLFDGATRLGGFANVELVAKTACAGLCG